MRILVAGMGRTGTMLLTSLCTDITGYKVEHHHYFTQELLDWAEIIITTKRDMREKIASTKRYLNGHYTWKQGTNPEVYNTVTEECQMGVTNYLNWIKYTEHIMVFEDYCIKPKEYIIKCFKIFDVEYTYSRIDELIEKYKEPVLPGHITRENNELCTYKETLTKEEIKAIERFFDVRYPDLKETLLYIEKYE